MPAVMHAPDVRSALVDVLELLRVGEDSLLLKADERIIAAVCKRAAVKAGQTLSSEEMQQLVRQLEQCEAPRTCPHGRPTVLHYSIEQLEKEFARR
jgi:DNA mismatch repair protein MutL